VRVFICLEKYKRNIWKIERNNKPSHKPINTTIILVMIRNPVFPWLSQLFPIVFPGLFYSCQVTRLPIADPTAISPILCLFQWLGTYLLESLRYYFHNFLRFLVYFFCQVLLFLITEDQFLIDFLFLAMTDQVMS